MRNAVESVVVLCAAIGAYAILALIGLFPDGTLPLVLAVAGAFGGFLYGRFGRRAAAAAAPGGMA
jgi:hypothetical membrane protein